MLGFIRGSGKVCLAIQVTEIAGRTRAKRSLQKTDNSVSQISLRNFAVLGVLLAVKNAFNTINRKERQGRKELNTGTLPIFTTCSS